MAVKAKKWMLVLAWLYTIHQAHAFVMDGLANTTHETNAVPATMFMATQSSLRQSLPPGENLVPTTMSNVVRSTSQAAVCEDTIETCYQYGRTACTQKVYEAWARAHCALYCGFCTPVDPHNLLCENKLHNCAEFDSGNLCTLEEYYSWAYENCKGYCKFDICNDSWCEDSKDANCPLLELAVNICADTVKAKAICKRHCHLCNVTDGKWCSWNSWSSCDVTCGNGTQIRRRQCACPTPKNGGDGCVGSNEETKYCSLERCPVHGGWSRWSEWGMCSVSCGIGLRRRNRECNNPSPSRFEDNCVGENVLYDICSPGLCLDGNWTNWGGWGQCSVTCGPGLKRRERNCTQHSYFLPSCKGEMTETAICDQTPCNVVHGGWSVWSSWSSCLSNCLRHRTRTCTNPSPSSLGHMCLGNTEDKENCNLADCAIDLGIRLVGGTSSHNGRVEVSSDGSHWGTVCDDNFDNNAAKVVCRMLGYSVSGASVTTVSSGGGSIYLDDVTCNGEETSLIYCSHRTWAQHNCAHGEDVGVFCH